jgi:nitric oxide synthase oxygenase domain/subunit
MSIPILDRWMASTEAASIHLIAETRYTKARKAATATAIGAAKSAHLVKLESVLRYALGQVVAERARRRRRRR